MKLMRLALVAAAFAMVGGIVMSEDMDVRALQAKLAAQEARITDLQAKMNQSRSDGGAANAVTSIRKNATVTIGGMMNARYLYRDGDVKSRLELANGPQLPGNIAQTPNRVKREDIAIGDLRLHDAKLEFKIDVTENVDAYIKLDLHDGARCANVSGVAQNYWVRWKNICDSGFGVLVGRDAVAFGDTQPIGMLDTWVKDAYGATGDINGMSAYTGLVGTGAGPSNTYGEGMFAFGSLLPAHSSYNWTRTTQITPYWENRSKTFKAELSFIQAIDRLNGSSTATAELSGGPVRKYRSINYGVGSMAARVTWTPIEGLKLVASGLNLYNRLHGGTRSIDPVGNRPTSGNAIANYGVETTSNNTAVNLAFRWRPCFQPKLQLFGQWTHGWNEAWVKDQDSDTLLFGAQYDFGPRWTVFAMGEYIRTKNDNGLVWHKASGWNAYGGVIYNLSHGAQIEVGYRHEEIGFKGKSGTEFSGKHTKYSGDVVYANLGFSF